VRIVTLHAVANRRGVNLAFGVGGLLVGVAGDAERHGGSRGQLHAGNIFLYPDLMATGAAHGDRRMNRLALALVLMALSARRRIRLGIEGYRMDSRPRRYRDGAY